MKNRKMSLILAAALSCSLLLAACGGDSGTASTGADKSGATSAGTSASASNSGDYTFRTSDAERVVTENGSFTKDQVEGPVLITSFGQSADVSMLDALMKKTGADYTFNATATAEDAAQCKTLIIACGASSKGLGAAGISQEDEIARAEAIIQAVADNDITVIAAHLGGETRRGPLSDQFNDMALGCADYIMVVEDGNKDGKFTDAAADAGVPVTLIYSIADALTPLTEIFG